VEPWRIAIVVAAAVFVLFLLWKMRPRDDEEPEAPGEPRKSRAERALFRRIRELPRPQQERLLRRLEKHLRQED
jgi:hypothetical protein